MFAFFFENRRLCMKMFHIEQWCLYKLQTVGTLFFVWSRSRVGVGLVWLASVVILHFYTLLFHINELV